MQSVELYSHPLRVLDVEARLGAPPVLQTALWSAGSPRLRYFRADSGWQRSAASRQVAARAPRGAMRPLRRQVQTIYLRRAACGIAATGGFDFLKCQTFAASPAEPGELLFWFSIPLRCRLLAGVLPRPLDFGCSRRFGLRVGRRSAAALRAASP